MLPPSSDISNINVQFGFKIKNGVPSRTEQNEKKMVQKIPPPPPKDRAIQNSFYRGSDNTKIQSDIYDMKNGCSASRNNFFFLQIGRGEGWIFETTQGNLAPKSHNLKLN